MKKIIGILGVAVIAATMFFSANNVNLSSSDASLASLVNMNVANAQEENSDANCLVAQVMVIKAYEENGKKCYRDSKGPDVLEGITVTCVKTTASINCQPLRCATETVGGGCYEL